MANQRMKTVLSHLERPDRVSLCHVSGEQLQYSENKGTILTQEQREFYEKNGFLLIKNLVPKHKIDKYFARFQQIAKGDVKVPYLTMMKDIDLVRSGKELEPGQEIVQKIQDFVFDDEMFEYCSQPEVLDYVQSFIGPNLMAMHSMLINKPPDTGKMTSRHPMHQDQHYFPFQPANKIVCSWTAMEHIHRGNGCLVVVPGSHKGELMKHTYPDWAGGVNRFYHGIQNYSPEDERAHLEMQKGDTVFFHPLLLHGSGANKTKGYRKAISCHYASSDCHYVDVKGTVQENVAEEIRELAEKRMGKDIGFDFRDLWRMKGRLVRGEAGNL